MTRVCIHPDQAGCKGMVRNSRPLQAEGVMELLAGADKQVYVMDRDVEPRVIRFEDDEPIVLTDFVKVPVKNAVTEAFFCERHAVGVLPPGQGALRPGEPGGGLPLRLPGLCHGVRQAADSPAVLPEELQAEAVSLPPAPADHPLPGHAEGHRGAGAGEGGL